MQRPQDERVAAQQADDEHGEQQDGDTLGDDDGDHERPPAGAVAPPDDVRLGRADAERTAAGVSVGSTAITR
ncbi:hypothetical protein GCM10025868_33030 [Angustibacter aerolatus]|uniref:Uncharacterized protein n=1 Tax=Angustibacter aerolatus TaxID=1162965 RepID=A0ABQ6JKX6_9ACTN|nr:hypothetical protein GCM10025868_33030 [Angustibacter aerolatus]